MKIAITGGAGFIGAHLTRAYLDAGHNVLVIDNLAHGFRQDIDPRARFYQVDIRDEKLRTILQMERPDIVSHHAAQQTDLPGEQALRDADLHIRGLLNVLDSCVNASVHKFIFASGGDSMYGHVASEALPVSEDMPLSLHTILTISVKQQENGMSATTPASIDSSIASCVTLTSMGIERAHPRSILSANFFLYYQNSVVLSFVERVKRSTTTFSSMMLSKQTSAH